MRKMVTPYLRSVISIFLFVWLAPVAVAQDVNIVPRPAEIIQPSTPGYFVINPSTSIVLEGSGLGNCVQFLNDYLNRFYGFTLKTGKSATAGKNAIGLNFERINHPIAGAYVLDISKNGIYIAGDNENGDFYGIQSLIQLLPLPGQPLAKGNNLSVPLVTIRDRPRFDYRGLHLDVGRHFFPVSFIKKYIDYLALHKMNYFHWHLTEDQGWRIEIKKYPLLTSIGSKRYGTIIGRFPGTGNDNTPYGGYYTQAQIKDIIAYAAKRYITIIPEIELPGHGSAAIASYPFLSCFPDEPTKMPSTASTGATAAQAAGTKKLVQETWGVFDDVFCAGKDSTFTFLENVLDEVITLFPSTYIHIGGDECPKNNWKRCPRCQQRMKELGLNTEHELQSYFIQRIEKYINSKGRKIIGWDEILEGGLAPNATVMSWRGEEGGIDAAKQNHQVIMTPGSTCYFDHSQTRNEDSVTIGGYLPIENVYNYEPIPAALTEEQAKKVWGAQGNVWTEYMGSINKVEYMVFPRLAALSEVLWSAKEKDYTNFEKRLPVQLKRYDLWKTNYSKAYYNIQPTVLPAIQGAGILWKLDTKHPQGKIKLAGEKKGWYTAPVAISTSMPVSAALYANNKRLDSIFVRFQISKATGKKITLSAPPAGKFPGNTGAFGLVNGMLSPKGLSSPEWLGWNGSDVEAVIDLGSSQSISFVDCHVLDQHASWIYKPASIEVLVSANGADFTPAGKSGDATADTLNMYHMLVNMPAANARYVKIIARNFGKIPEGQPGASNPSWLLIDEIQVD
jgi:hexosaminidase